MDRLFRSTQTGQSGNTDDPSPLTLPEGAVVDVIAAEYVGDYALRLRFSDGAERIVNFEPFLRGSSNPMIRAYLDPGKFLQFRLDQGDLVWNDYDLCFPIADLYEGRV